MAKGKKTGGRDFKLGHPPMGGRPRVPEDLKLSRVSNRIEFERALNKYTRMTGPEINEAIRSLSIPITELITAKILAKAFNEGDQRRFEFILDRLIGKPTDMPDLPPLQSEVPIKKSFTDFCLDSNYPKPYPKQIEMVDFALTQKDPRLLLGARGTGKTDYVTILGIAYYVYMNGPSVSCLILTKERKRGAAILAEIASALKANGIVLEKENSSCIRVAGRLGKDHSVECLSIRSGLRGRHPDIIVMDDPVTEEDVSEATRDLVMRKYNEAYKLVSNIIIIGQPAHRHDLYAKLRPLLKKMEVPHGTIPELDHDLEAMALAGVDSRSIEMSYHLRIPVDGTAPFEQIRYIDKFPIGDSVAFLDPSHKGEDFTALSSVRQHFQGVAVKGRVWKKAWNHCLDEIVAELKAVGVKKLCVETNGLGDQPVIMLRQLLKGMGIGVVGKDSVLNKHAKIMAAGAYAHLIHLSKESDRAYIDQTVQYEYKSKNDDAPDSLASCLEWIGYIRGKTRGA